MLEASRRTLKLLAAVVWYVGGIVLLVKGGTLLLEAADLGPGRIWTWFAVPLGLAIGLLKAKLIFVKACRKNLDRIAALERPRIWLCCRPLFLVFLAAMILTAKVLTDLTEGDYAGTLGVAVLDFTIGVALLGSAHVFWRKEEA